MTHYIKMNKTSWTYRRSEVILTKRRTDKQTNIKKDKHKKRQTGRRQKDKKTKRTKRQRGQRPKVGFGFKAGARSQSRFGSTTLKSTLKSVRIPTLNNKTK